MAKSPSVTRTLRATPSRLAANASLLSPAKINVRPDQPLTPSCAPTRAHANLKRAIEVVDMTISDEPKITTMSAKRQKLLGIRPKDANALPAQPAPDSKKRPAPKKKEDTQQITLEWKRKFKRAFPSFVFYFYHLDANAEAHATRQVQELGATVEGFFSKKVTHVVTTYDIPEYVARPSPPQIDESNKENTKQKPAEASTGPLRRQRPSHNKPLLAKSPPKYKSPTKVTKLAPAKDKDFQVLLHKAAEFGMKRWKVEKLQKILNQLIEPKSPSKVAAQHNAQSLPNLLRTEALTGITHERDPEVLRPDYHYFPVKSCYILIEDTYGDYAPIISQEYERPRRNEPAKWPVLLGGQEGRSAFTKPPQPSRVDALTTIPNLAPAARAVYAAGAGIPSLRRTVSLNQLQKQAAPAPAKQPLQPSTTTAGNRREASGFLAASGNSVVITSNTGTTSTRSGALGFPARVDVFTDKRLAALGKRQLVTLSGSAGYNKASTSNGTTSGSEKFAVPKLPIGKLHRSISMDTGLNTAKLPVPVRPHVPKPGYCENCRVRYEDFKEHIVSRKHEKFANSEKNFAEIDKLVAKYNRPILSRLDFHITRKVAKMHVAANLPCANDLVEDLLMSGEDCMLPDPIVITSCDSNQTSSAEEEESEESDEENEEEGEEEEDE